MSLISVVVPTRNRAGVLPHLLDALASQTYPRFEIIVVDDASDDGTPGILGAWAGEGRIALRLDRPRGSYVARNVGWRRARGDIVAFTDDDCIPEREWLSNLERALRDPETVGVQGATLVGSGEITPFTHQIEQRRPGPPYRTCNIAYRRSLLVQLGGFETMRWYADNILGLRARQRGAIAFATGAVVLHPPRPRGWRDREAWLARFEADATHRRWLRELGAERLEVGKRGLPLVLWVLRPLAKQSRAHVRYLVHHPSRYLVGMRPMLREKRELLSALRASRTNTSSRRAAPLPALGPNPLVSVIVVTRDRPASLRHTLAALAGQSYPEYETVVVDHSADGSARAVVDAAGARWVAAAGGTLASARQVGVDAAAGEVVAFTDDDCLPDGGWLGSLVAALHAQPHALGAQGRTIAERGHLGDHAVAVSGPDQLYRTCNIAYRRAAIDAVGGFDRRFTGWFEDTALGAKIVERGKIVFVPSAVITHRAMPHPAIDRETWGRLLADERLLATAYPGFYRRTRGPGFVPTVLARWLIGSPLKTLWRALPQGLHDLSGYRDLLIALFRERIALLNALLEMLFGGRVGR